jgi:hypothetical protein
MKCCSIFPLHQLPIKLTGIKATFNSTMLAAMGPGQKSFSNGAAYGDLDNDGDLDLVVNNENQPSFIYRNNSREINKYHYFGAILKGDTGNLYAIGSRITVHAGGQMLYREFVPSRGFQSSMDYRQIIGSVQRIK